MTAEAVVDPNSRSVVGHVGMLAAAVAVLAVIALAALLLVGPEGRIHIRVFYDQGNAAFVAGESVYLQIGSTAWDAHTASVPARDPVVVRLVGRNTCRTYTEFVAAPESSWEIRLRDGGTVTAQEVEGLEASSANGSRKRTVPCPTSGS